MFEPDVLVPEADAKDLIKECYYVIDGIDRRLTAKELECSELKKMELEWQKSKAQMIIEHVNTHSITVNYLVTALKTISHYWEKVCYSYPINGAKDDNDIDTLEYQAV